MDKHTDRHGNEWQTTETYAYINAPAVYEGWMRTPAAEAALTFADGMGVMLTVRTVSGATYQITVKDDDTVQIEARQSVSIHPTGTGTFLFTTYNR